MPTGSSTADHLMPPPQMPSQGKINSPAAAAVAASSSKAKQIESDAMRGSTGANSLDEVGSLVSTTSVSKLLELGEVADNAAATVGRSSTRARSNSKFTKELVLAAQQDLARLFGITDDSTTAFKGNGEEGMVSVMEIAAGEIICKEMEVQSALYYIISGSFVVTQLQSVGGPVSWHLTDLMLHIIGNYHSTGNLLCYGSFINCVVFLSRLFHLLGGILRAYLSPVFLNVEKLLQGALRF